MVRFLAPKKTKSLEMNSKQVVLLPNCGFAGQEELEMKKEKQNCYDMHGTQVFRKGVCNDSRQVISADQFSHFCTPF